MFEFVLGVIVAAGLVGVALLMFAENIIPPIPSEVVMPLAGFAAAQGNMSFAAVVAAGTLGAVAGASAWYAVGLRVNGDALRGWVQRHGRWLTIDLDDLDRSQRVFKKHGALAVFAGRLVPGVRTFISVPAGVVRMPAPVFIGWTTLGTALWTLLLAGAGYLLEGEYHRVERWLDPATQIVIGSLAVLYAYRVWRARTRTSDR
jgi:membrane protein DedA with SNARE-associated domain